MYYSSKIFSQLFCFDFFRYVCIYFNSLPCLSSFHFIYMAHTSYNYYIYAYSMHIVMHIFTLAS